MSLIRALISKKMLTWFKWSPSYHAPGFIREFFAVLKINTKNFRIVLSGKSSLFTNTLGAQKITNPSEDV